MKKLLILVLIFLLTACSNNTLPDLSSEYILSVINEKVTFDNPVQEDMKEQSVAERYGISPKNIENGVVYYTEDEDKSDKIIIVKAASKDAVENIERALSSEIVGISDAWRDDANEMDKIEKHILNKRHLCYNGYI